MTIPNEQKNSHTGQLTLLVVAVILALIFAWRHILRMF
jgi:hypothetical protein